MIRDVMPVLHRVETQFISRPVNDAALDSGSRHPCRESIWMMVTAPAEPFHARRTAELGSPHDDCFVQQAALLQILQQTRDRLVHLGAELAVVLLKLGMSIPLVLAAAAVIDLHEADALFDQTPRREAAFAERARLLLVEARTSCERAPALP